MCEYVLLSLGLVIILLISIIFIRNRYLSKNINMYPKIKDFESYMAVLSYHMEKAYDLIYKDRIMIYSLEASKPSNAEVNAAIVDFSNLVKKLLGPNLIFEFLTLYGNEETFYFNLAEYFSTRFENDEIRKTSTENVMNSNLEDQKPL